MSVLITGARLHEGQLQVVGTPDNDRVEDIVYDMPADDAAPDVPSEAMDNPAHGPARARESSGDRLGGQLLP
jgi:hypothetical protein